jgi:GntR family transcriptional regulator/MocR family aminotransferase
MKRSRLSEALPAGLIVAVDRNSPTPLYRQLYHAYRDAITERRLRAGERLPSTRGLADELGISRLPVIDAFEQLLAEGYFEARVGVGTFVARALPGEMPAQRRAASAATGERGGKRVLARRPEALLGRGPEPWLAGRGAFRLSQPAIEHFPFRVWSTLLARQARSPKASLLHYGDPLGYLPFREAVAAYLRAARAVRCEADQVMVVSGSQQALEIAARVLLDPGSSVWVEDPGYGGARDALTMAGARLVPVPVDEDGLDVAAGIARSPRARAVHVTPSHQYPLGATLSASRRMRLLDWARASGAWILEDDYDSEYRYQSQPVAALQGLDRDARVVYIGTLSKILFPGLRVGYLVIPRDLVARFAAVRDAMDIFPPTLPQAALADFLADGHFARHLRRTRQIYRERRGVLVEALRRELGGTVEVLGDQAGMHLVAALPDGTHDRRLAERAAGAGLWAMPLSTCYLGDPRPGLVLGYGGTGVDEIRDGVRRLRRVIEED